MGSKLNVNARIVGKNGEIANVTSAGKLETTGSGGGGGGGDVNITEIAGNAIGADSLPIDDGGNSITVDDGGTSLTVDGEVDANVHVAGTAAAATNPVPVQDQNAGLLLAGSLYTYSKILTVTPASPKTVRISVENDMVATVKVRATGAAHVNVYELPLFTAVGEWETARNRARDSLSNQASPQPHFDPAAVYAPDTGVLLAAEIVDGQVVISDLLFQNFSQASALYAVVVTDLSGSSNNASVTIDYRYI